MPSAKVDHDVSHLSGRSAPGIDLMCRRGKESKGTNLLVTFVVVAIARTLCFPGGFSEDT